MIVLVKHILTLFTVLLLGSLATLHASDITVQREQIPRSSQAYFTTRNATRGGYAAENDLKAIFYDALHGRVDQQRFSRGLDCQKHARAKSPVCACAWRWRHSIQGMGQEVERSRLRCYQYRC